MHIVILGAGLSGLATGWFIKQIYPSVRLSILEKSQKSGGWIRTISKDGFQFEQGPQSCRGKKVGFETLALVESLGIEKQLLHPSTHATDRYIYHNQKLRKAPKKIWEIPFRTLTQGWLKLLWHEWNAPKKYLEDESVHDFFTRRIGPTWTERLVDPLISGIYAGDPRLLSVKSCFPLFDQWEEHRGSLLKAIPYHQSTHVPHTPFTASMCNIPLFSFREGMQVLPQTLAQKLQDSLHLQKNVKEISIQSEYTKICLESGEEIQADHLISTLATKDLAKIMEINHPEISMALDWLSYVDVVIINLGFHENILRQQGFGYLIPSSEKSSILGCIWGSSIFPSHNSSPTQSRLTVMMGGRQYPEAIHLSDQEITRKVLTSLQKQLGIYKEPSVIHITKARQAIPQYEIGYLQWKKQIQNLCCFPHFTLSGTAFGGVAIHDCIAQAREIAQKTNFK